MSWLSNLFSRWFPRRPTVPPPAPVPVGFIGDLLAAHNTLRLNRTIGPLVLASELIRAAQEHANAMAANDSLTHGDFAWRIREYGYQWTGCAENIAGGQQTVAEVMRSWQESRGHLANILGPYREVGFGLARSTRGIYWCADFGSRYTIRIASSSVSS